MEGHPSPAPISHGASNSTRGSASSSSLTRITTFTASASGSRAP